jgi:hypothetical protein
MYIFHFQFCNNGLFQGDDVTALTDDITYTYVVFYAITIRKKNSNRINKKNRLPFEK